MRNKSAHPSGHKPSAEEARFVFYETVSRFLAKPVLSTAQIVEQLIEKLSNDNFFPSTAVDHIAEVVAEEIKHLHDEAVPQLVTKLGGAATAVHPTARNNAVHFLVGLAKLDRSHVNSSLQTKLITPKVDDSAYSDAILQTISANGGLVENLSPATVSRIRAAITQTIRETTGAIAHSKLIHPISILKSVASALPDGDLLLLYQTELDALFAKWFNSLFVINLVKAKPALLPSYVRCVVSRAGSSSFDVSKAFAYAIDSLDAPLAELFSDEQAFQVVVAVARAANNGTWAAENVVNAKFSSVPLLRSKAISYIDSEKIAAGTYASSILTHEINADTFAAQYLGVSPPDVVALSAGDQA